MGRLEALWDTITQLDQDIGAAEQEAVEAGMELAELVAMIAGLS